MRARVRRSVHPLRGYPGVWRSADGWTIPFCAVRRRLRSAARRVHHGIARGRTSVHLALAEFWTNLWWRVLRHLLKNLGRQGGMRGCFRLKVPVRVSPENAERIEQILSLQEALGDWKGLSDLGEKSRAADSSFHIEPEEVTALCRRILELDLPFLELGGVLADGAQGERVEVIERQVRAVVQEPVTLLCPEVTTIESRWRDGELSYRPADALADLYRLPLHERVLPPALLMDLLLKGELYVPGRAHRPMLEFTPREVVLPQERLVTQPVVCALPNGASDEPKRIVYFLIDTSQSMRGPLAVLAAAIVRAVVLTSLGRPRVLFARAFADDVEPVADRPPHAARSTAERIELADWVMGQSFGGPETRLMQALLVCLRDIQQAREQPEMQEMQAAEVIAISDGRSTILPFLQDDIRKSGIRLHVVSLGSYRNPELEAVAASFSVITDPQSLQVAPLSSPADGRETPRPGRRPAVSAGA